MVIVEKHSVSSLDLEELMSRVLNENIFARDYQLDEGEIIMQMYNRIVK
ncbi:hypothetical protein A35E_00362 [secondary endosymbiont of Heteropsylla cubana]|uniref:Uncharacterized protein n=1 Tax=secondary endosymbiont of Heteropsylla cubana TaxID=134287 RepID=J3Z5P0_9ENTR|nr:hypothetical protein A35E_00362 [secondary endosymbiont of Heteropsylla cubana]